MSEFVRDIYIPEYDTNLVHLKLLSPGQKPQEFDPNSDLGRVYSIFDLISLGKGRMQAGIDQAFDVIKSEKENIYGEAAVFAPEYKKEIEVNEDGDYEVKVVEFIRDSRGEEREVFDVINIYSQEELIAAGKGDIKKGIDNVGEATEKLMGTNLEESEDINMARPRLDLENRPYGDEIAIYSAPKEAFKTH